VKATEPTVFLSLAERLGIAAREHADAIALVDGARRISYRELLARADALAAELHARGLGSNDLVGVALPRSAELVIAIAGIVRAGAAYLPLDLAQPAERRALILSDAGPRVVVTDGTPLLGLPDGSEALALSRASARTLEARPQPAPGDLAYVIYTSGSTGRPNGVRVTQHNVARLFQVSEPLYGFGPADCWTLFHSIAFDFSVWELWGALLYGGRLVVVPEAVAKAADLFHALVLAEGVSVLNQTPSAFRAFDRADAAAGRPASRLRLVIFGGEALDPRTLRAWFEAHGDEAPRLVNMYGITETTVHVTYRPLRAADARGTGASLIGNPLPDLRLELLDAQGQPVRAGETGELWVGGEGVADGYLARPSLTAERFRPDPRGSAPGARLYRSGDLARRTPDGDLEYLGRADLQVKLRGFRIELGEIEAALRESAGVRDAVVALREDPLAGPRLVAWIVSEPGAALDAAALRAQAARRLPEYMVPAAYVRIERVPRTGNDKVDRSVLPEPTAADLPRDAGGEAPRDELERAVAGIYAGVLGTAVATRESDFFRLGGHSLLAWRVVVLCQERLGAALSVQAVFAHPRVGDLAQCLRLEQQAGRGAPALPRVPRGLPQPLTPQQQALWLELKLRTHADVYNEPIAFRVETPLAPQRVRRALGRLAARHELLRARLVEREGEPYFVVDDAIVPPELELLDGAADLQALLRRPFDLARGPLWRAALRPDPRGGSLLLLVLHHIVLDAASEEILLRDFAAACAEPEAALPVRELDFFDLARREREQLAAGQPALERFWAGELAGAQLSPELPPPCVPCAPGEESRGCATRRVLPTALARSVRALAAELGTTPFQVYFAAYLALLRSWCASDDLVVGSPVSLRETPESRDVVGYLLNPVALRVRLAGSRSFRETVAEVARRWQEARAHARLPLHLVLQAARGATRAGVGSPFQVFFSLVQDSKAGLAIDGHTLLAVHVPPPHVKFQLFLLVEEREQDASLTLEFQRGVLDPQMGERLLAQLEHLLREATGAADAPLARLALLEPGERERLRALGTCERPYARESSVPDLFEEVVRQRGSATALVAGAQQISYAELDRRANAVAAVLRRAGVERGQRVPLLIARGPRFVACALGVLKCGAAYVPLDPAYPTGRLGRMLEGLGARVGLREPGSAHSLGGPSWLDARCADTGSAEGAPPRELGADDPAYVMFTSGSTGRPKGVEVPQRAIVRLVRAQDFARMSAQETWLHMAPTSFDASTLEIWAALLNGGRCVVLEESLPTPARIAEAIRSQGVTSAWFTAPLFNALVDEAPETLAGLTQVLVGGEALSPAHMQRAQARHPGVRFVNGYGPTENTTFTCCHVIEQADLDSGRPIPIGRPIANTSVQVLDRDGQLVPVGVPGELVAGGDGVALGYAGRPDATAEKFLPDTLCARPGGRLYRSGDRVRWRPDGLLEFLGRFDEQLKIRGHRIEPGEIVACLGEHPQVRRAAVVPRRTSAGALQLVAYVVAQGTQPAPDLPRLLLQHATERLPAYMLPASIVLVPDLPLKPNGKLDVEALEQLPQPAAQAPPGAQLTQTETSLLAIWREALKLPTLGVDDDFFEAGGDSLLAVRMLARAERELGLPIPVRTLVEGRTVRHIAALRPSAPGTRLPPGVVRVREGDPTHALFCLPGLGGVALQFERLAAKLRTRRAVFAVELHDLEIAPSRLESLVETAATVAECMRAVQPKGPYSILGYSYGGNVAVEVARELIRQGQRVELVAVLDSYAPGSLRAATGLGKILRHVRILRRLGPRGLYGYLTPRVLRRLGLRGPEVEPARPPPTTDLERRLQETESRGLRAFGAYRPGPFEGRILLVHATDLGDWMETADPSGTCGWGAICTGGVDLIHIGCKHLDLFRGENIAVLAQRLDEVLDSVHGP
jgi:amino acid adenylation domain-containing protein